MTPSLHALRSVPSFHVDVSVGAKVTSFHFKRAKIAIGSLAENDLVLPDASVPDRFGTLHLLDTTHSRDKFTLVSPSGGMNDLEDGATIAVGRYRLTMTLGDPPPEREQEFLRHLEENPADDAMRVVYADWLEENGRASAAHFIRAQLDLATMKPDSPAFLDAKDVLHALSGSFPAHWRRTIARPEIENCGVRFELQCPKQWTELQATVDPNQRFCGTCQRNVHYAPTVTAARRLALAGACVVVDVAQPRRFNDLADEERYVLAGMIAPPREG